MEKGNAIKSLNILHKALLTGPVLLAAICFYLVYSEKIIFQAQELDRSLQVMAIIIAVAGVFTGTSVFKKKLLQAREMEAGAAEKFAVYRAASILQWALLEGPSIFCIISFFLTGNYAFLALAGVVMFLFVMTAPSKTKILLQLQISEAELDDL